jgi:DNA-binding NarL/FixJ family response regulator
VHTSGLRAARAQAACGSPSTRINRPAPPLIQTYIVEDSPVIREQLVATLEELAPVRVVGTAEDQASAVGWLAESGGHGVDLVIVDLFLAAGSGLGVLRQTQALPRRFRMVVLTNYATPDMRRTCLALGADRVFDKSTEIDALVSYCVLLAADAGPAASPAP